MHHLDTSTVIAYFRGNLGVAEKLAQFASSIGLSTPALAELHYGIHLSRNPAEKLDQLNKLIERFQIVRFDEDAARTYGRVRHELRMKGQIIEEMDLLIAAVAINHDATLVTHNTRHFSRVSGLVIQNWVND